MNLGSLFDGSGGFPLAASLCGITPVWASEVEPYPIAVTKSRFPKMKHLGDISKINGAEIEPVDVITFGSPCQDLSVAGKRAGLKHEDNGDDETTRSGLFMEAVRIIKEMREATNGIYPRFALWENVPGAFSSNKGEDFRTVLEELIKVVEPAAVMPAVPKAGWAYADSYVGDGWSIAYRVFDAQYWGVPQRRRRIYLVADFRGECAGKVLFERESLRGYPAESGTPWQRTAADAEGSLGADDREGAVGVIYAVDQGGGKSGANVSENLSPTLTCTHGGEPAVAYTLEPGIAAREGGHIYEGVSGTLRANAGDNQMAVAFTQNQRDEVRDLNGVAGALAAEQNSTVRGDTPLVCVPYTLKIRSGCEGGGKGALIQKDKSATLATNNDQYLFQPVPNILLDDQGGQQVNVRTDDKSPTLRAEAHGNVPAVVMEPMGINGEVAGTLDASYYKGCGMRQGVEREVVAQPIPIHDQATRFSGKRGDKSDGKGNGLGVGNPGEPANTLTSGDRHAVGYRTGGFADYVEGEVGTLKASGGDLGGESENLIVERKIRYIVRRLTPTECARLQGFPDPWGHINPKEDLTDEEYAFWTEVRVTYDVINGREPKTYGRKQMLAWYNKLWTDSAEYKMWGNGIALPCALYVMSGIAEICRGVS